ncbi:hypothetical protein BCV69DRAFT_283949 [Microstroma glucosiphilum]|uniref:SH3 domain-containing protein n=1 Tax=Pseudomicrostroma glucosiphilum TaxID=1684307 RepID=A0A316U4T7_9BASI|nr:hypothetical protein BCV69DRAFT_283949 [Pseudomicrostroma glucosiphilum]PWN19844.1 hypothetical protein BCV69DRAFT_283949 [Pseudomicrostroma glucosiphilum]
MSSFPYTARSIKKYRSPHAQDLSFPKGAVIRVLSLAPKAEVDEDDDDEDEDQWLIGELADGSAKGSFPGTCVVAAPEEDAAASQSVAATSISNESAEPAAVEASDSTAEPSIAQAQTAEAPSIQEAATTAGEELSVQDVPTSAAPQSATIDAAQPDSETLGLKEPTHTPAPLSLDTNAAVAGPTSPTPATVTTSAASTPKAAPSAPTSPAKAGPPPPKPKPSGLAARIAAFNQPAAGTAAPPPLPRGGKPPGSSTGGWKRPQPKEGEKPVLPGAPPAVSAKPVNASISRSTPDTSHETAQATTAEGSETAVEEGKNQGTGFSAADAASSIKLSLKERMAALQRGGEGEATGASPSSPSSAKSPPPLAAKPGRLTADRRAAAMVGMGVGGVAAKSSESLLSPTGDNAPADGQTAASAEPLREAMDTEGAEQAPNLESEDGAPKEQPTIAIQSEEDGGDAPSEISPEEEEAQRRAAIAQRLARLGGQRVGGQGPPMFGAPRPPPAKKTSTSSTDSTPVPAAPVDPQPTTLEAEPTTTEQEEEKPKTLDVPRRAAPPRKKRSAASPLPSEAESNVLSPTSTDLSPSTTTNLTGADDASIVARAGSPEPIVPSEEEALASKDVAMEEPLASSSATLPSAPGASTPPPPGLPDEDPSEGPDLVSGPPPPEQVADPGSTAEHIKSVERTAPIEEAGIQAEREEEEKQTAPVVQEDDMEDVALKLQAARLEAFLAGSQDSASKRYGDSLDVDEDDESSAIPSPLARQLGLAPTQESEGGAGQGSGAFGDEPSAIEADQRRMGEELNEARGATPAPVETEDGGLTSVPSRPGSTRPPIPLGNRPGSRASIGPPARHAPTPPVPTSALEERRSSIISVGRPPIPRSPPPRAPSTSIEETLMGDRSSRKNEEDDAKDAAGAAPPAAGPALAVPLPRRAMPVDEEEEEQDMEDGPSDVRSDESAALPAASAESEDQPAQDVESEESSVLSPEQEEAARRAAIAKRMAALGGHRMGALPPIMGAPMPARRKATEPVPEPQPAEEEEAATAPVPARRAGPPRGGMAIPGMTRPIEPAEAESDGAATREVEDEQQEDLDVDADNSMTVDEATLPRVSSPPPMPASPPPVPSGVNRASFIQGHKPMSPPPPPPGGAGRGSIDEGLARRGSTNRPPIPGAAPPPPPPKAVSRGESQYDQQPSIESSLASYEDYDQQQEDDEYDDEEAYAQQSSPPALPSSPPPRAPSAAPLSSPPPPPTSSAAAYEPQMARSGSISTQGAPARAPPGTRTSVSGPVGGKSSARDLDLAPHTRWWRGSGELDPMRLPPSISSRPDAIYFVENAQAAQAGEHHAVVRVLFEDFSVTLVNVVWFDEDEDETETRLEQEHSFPPKKPQVDEMKAWSSTLGVDLAQRALMLLQSGGGGKGAPSSPYPHSLALVSHLIRSSRSPCLPPVGFAFGPTVLSQVGQTVLDKAAGDEAPRAGDVLLLQGPADFKGKKGLGSSYHVAYGGAQQPLFAIVVEVEKGKKGGLKIRAVTQQTASVEEVTLKLEDLKSGVLKVMRVTRRGEWVHDW